MDGLLRPRTAALAAVALLALAPASALANKHIVAPGDPGSAQYQEDVPTAGGSRPVTSVHPSTGSTPVSAVLPRAVVKKLSSAGKVGRESLGVAVATAPTRSSSNGHKQGAALHPKVSATATLVASALLGSGGGMGTLLPILLIASLIVVLGLAGLRRRGR